MLAASFSRNYLISATVFCCNYYENSEAQRKHRTDRLRLRVTCSNATTEVGVVGWRLQSFGASWQRCNALSGRRSSHLNNNSSTHFEEVCRDVPASYSVEGGHLIYVFLIVLELTGCT